MEAMRNLCQRYKAKAICRVMPGEPFSEQNVRGWADKLRVSSFITTFVPANRAEISIANSTAGVATLYPFAESPADADAWVVLRRSLFEAGRLPAVDLTESSSKLADGDPNRLAQRVKAEIARGNAALSNYLSQPFFVAEPWTSRPGEVTEREETLEYVRGMMAGN
jgi:F0F1-type ATP synthase beta subunit